MARIQFTDEVSPAQRGGEVFPKLKLKMGEKARVALLEGPEQTYVHQMYEPLIVDGRGVKVQKERRDKSTYEAYDEKFLKSFQCLGDEETLFQSGADAKNCPACRASAQASYFKAPTPRYALNVIKYGLKPNGDISSPYSPAVQVWVFGPQKFEEIRNIAKEGFDLSKVDLVLGPCQHEDFQKYTMTVSNKAAWLENKDTEKTTMEAFRENRIEDLAKVIAPKLDADMIQGYVDRINHAWNVINGTVVSPTEAVIAASEFATNSTPAIDFGSTSTVSDTSSAEDFGSLLDGLDI
jgi:hypothetical protein